MTAVKVLANAQAPSLTTSDSVWLVVADGRISDIGSGPPPEIDNADTVDCSGLIITPGFIDQHCHGGGGAAFTEGAASARIAAGVHLAHGTTTLMASLVSAAPDDLLNQITALRPVVDDGTVCGIHLEGPWISHLRCGAHDPAALRAPDPGELASVIATGEGTIAMVTLAPELEGGIDAVRQFAAAGVVVGVGHTDATDAMTRTAIAAGATVATHLFNAMPALEHREPGPVGALLRDPRVIVELIADGLHVHPDVLAVAMAAAGPERVALITDAMAAAGSTDGDYLLGSLQVTVSDGAARLKHGGALAGSTLTLDEALRHMVHDAGVSLNDAITSLTATPARVLGLTDRGRLAIGLRADLALLDSGLMVRGVLRDGTWTIGPRRGTNQGG